MTAASSKACALLRAVNKELAGPHDVAVIAFATGEFGSQRGKAVPVAPQSHFYVSSVKDKRRLVDWLRHVADGIERTI